jgi:chemosensory pili system protein ChpA (sensor histidine kinase/response regulator)
MVLILDVPGLMDSRTGRAEGTVARVARAAPAREIEAATVKSAADSAPRLKVAPVKAPPAADESASARVRVLFVDDSLSVRKVAEKALVSLGAQVTTAVDGLDALEKMRDRTFDIVFTDLEMPRMHGFELIRELRFLTAHQDLPIVVVTSRSGQKHQEQARALGANEYLTKPFNTQSLGAAIEKHARGRRSEKGE